MTGTKREVNERTLVLIPTIVVVFGDGERPTEYYFAFLNIGF